MAQITYHPGSGVKDKASFRLGKASVPASVVTRLLSTLEGKQDQGLDFAFAIGLQKYGQFLEALEINNLTAADCVAQFKALRPRKQSAGLRATRVEKSAEVFSKLIAKRFKGDDPAKLVDAFLAVVNQPEFKTEVIDVLKAYKKQFGLSPLKHIKTTDRQANPKAMKALDAWRAGQKKKKK